MMFPQEVPEVEPPVGTVAIFNSSFESGAGCSTNMMIRTEQGWQERPGDRPARSWQELTDLDRMNAETLKRNPTSSALFISVQVQIVASPTEPLTKVRAVADDLMKRGTTIEEKGSSGSIYDTLKEGRGIGYREAARSIYKALEG